MIKLEKDDTEESLTFRFGAVERKMKAIKADIRVMKDELIILQEIKAVVAAKLKMIKERRVI